MATLNPDDAAAIEKYMSDVLQIHTPAGQQPDPALIQFVQAELDAHHGATTGLDGFNVTQVGSTNDFMQLVKFAEAQAAYDHFAAGAKFGKVVLVEPISHRNETLVPSVVAGLVAADQQNSSA